MADEEPRDYRSIIGMDPAANWLLGPARDDYLGDDPEDTPIPFLIELLDAEAVTHFETFNREVGVDALVLRFDDEDLLEEGAVVPVLASINWFELMLLVDNEHSQALRNANKRIVLSSPAEVPDEVLLPDLPELPDGEGDAR